MAATAHRKQVARKGGEEATDTEANHSMHRQDITQAKRQHVDQRDKSDARARLLQDLPPHSRTPPCSDGVQAQPVEGLHHGEVVVEANSEGKNFLRCSHSGAVKLRSVPQASSSQFAPRAHAARVCI